MHNSCTYIVVIELHELHMYIVSHYIVHCICCNSCNLSNITHAYKNTLSYNELQMSYKLSLQFKNPIARLVTNHPFFHSVTTIFIFFNLLVFPNLLVIGFKMFLKCRNLVGYDSRLNSYNWCKWVTNNTFRLLILGWV